MMGETLFELKDMRVWYPIRKGFPKRVVGHVKAVDDVTLNIEKGEILGVVGESGCGKTTLGKALMMLNPPTDGEVLFDMNGVKRDITKLTPKEMIGFRSEVQMIFQDPYSALNPMKKIYTAFEEPLKVQGIRNRTDREEIMCRALELVNIPTAYLYKYPHEFSGGQRQRICIARAMQVNPKTLVCDEAVSALDVSIQAQVLNLMKKIQRERNMTYVFIAHDLSVVEYMSNRILVMYLGEAVELAGSHEMQKNPLHPYTKSLLSAIPVPKIHQEKHRIVLQGDVPSPINKPSGCPFHERCNHCMEICKKEKPHMIRMDAEGKHCVACHLYDDIEKSGK